MAIFDIFTGAPAVNAAGANTGMFTGAKNQTYNLADITRRATEDYLRGGYGGARTDLGQGYDASTGAINTGYGNAGTALDQGYGAATGAINTGAGNALGYLDAGQGGALGRLDAAKAGVGGAYAPLSALAGRYGAGAGLYADALGINGPEGNARATGAFQAGPGYDFAVTQGLDAISRRRNAAGAGPGGNVDRDAQLFGIGAANQEYGNWLNRLSPYNQLELSATSGAASGNAAENAARAGLDVNAAGLLDRGGTARANIATGQGGTLADIANRYYGGQANLATGQGNTLSDLARSYYGQLGQGDIGLGTALTGNMNQNTGWLINAENNAAGKIAGENTAAANAELQGTKNLWNLGIQAATAGAGGLGGMGGGTAFLPSSSFLNNKWGF